MKRLLRLNEELEEEELLEGPLAEEESLGELLPGREPLLREELLLEADTGHPREVAREPRPMSGPVIIRKFALRVLERVRTSAKTPRRVSRQVLKSLVLR